MKRGVEKRGGVKGRGLKRMVRRGDAKKHGV